MKKYVVVIGLLTLAATASVWAFTLPGGGGGKVDTTKIDAALKAIDDSSAAFGTAKGKVDTCTTNLNALATKYGIANVLTDPVAAAGLKDKITAEEKEALTKDGQTLATIPTDIAGITQGIPDIMTKVADAITDVATQITKNPLSAGDLKNKQDKLTAGKATLDQITTDAPALVDSAKDLATAITGML